MIGGDVPFYLKFWVKLTVLERKTPIFDLCLSVAPQPQHLTHAHNIKTEKSHSTCPKMFIHSTC